MHRAGLTRSGNKVVQVFGTCYVVVAKTYKPLQIKFTVCLSITFRGDVMAF